MTLKFYKGIGEYMLHTCVGWFLSTKRRVTCESVVRKLRTCLPLHFFEAGWDLYGVECVIWNENFLYSSEILPGY